MKKKMENNNEAICLADCLDRIYEVETGTNDDAADIEKDYEYVCGRMNLTRRQALLFAAILELGIAGDATPEKLASRLGCSNLQFIACRQDIDVLMNMRLVRSASRGMRGDIYYSVSEANIKCIQRNEVPSKEDIKGLSHQTIIRKMNNLFRDYWNDNISKKALYAEFNEIIKQNPESRIGKALDAYGIGTSNSRDEEERMLLLYMLVRYSIFREKEWNWGSYASLFDCDDDDLDFSIKDDIENEDLDIQEKGLVEFANCDGMADRENICLSSKARKEFLGEADFANELRTNCSNIIPCNRIKAHELFYNEEEGKQIDTLTALLQQENFANIVRRLEEKGMRKGFACIFHGSAGTGKTESVYQIARKTGRDIFLVDVSQLKSKWVGESEKQVQKLFEEYRRIVHNCEVAPILLFNEADAIFGLRKKGAEGAVDKMENSIQNIILQEMERLEGILIATTNLTENFDPAFERRFLYKIHFKRPDLEAKTKIWESMIEGLDKESAAALADEYDFSGGQIENIIRKMTVDFILTGVTPEFEQIRQLCAAETLEGKPSRNRIGY